MPSQLYMADYTSPLRAKAQGKRALGQAAASIADEAVAAYKDSAAREGHVERLVSELKTNLVDGSEAEIEMQKLGFTSREHASDWIKNIEARMNTDKDMPREERTAYIKGEIQQRIISAQNRQAKEGMSGLAGSPSAVSALPTSARLSGDPILDGVDQLVANKAQQPPVDGEGESTTTTSLSSLGWGQQPAGAMGALPAQQTGPLAWNTETLRNESDPRLRSFGDKVDMYNKLGLAEDKSILKDLVDEKSKIDTEIATENRQSQEKGEDRAFKAEQAAQDRANKLAQARTRASSRPPSKDPNSTKYAQLANQALLQASNISAKLSEVERSPKVAGSLGLENEVAQLKSQFESFMTDYDKWSQFAEQEAVRSGYTPPKETGGGKKTKRVYKDGKFVDVPL